MNKKIEDIKEKYNKSNKYVLYLDYYDIRLLFEYIKDLEDENNFLKYMIKDTDLYKSIK